MRVGLTFFLRKGDKNRSIWQNGADQNCVYLWRLLQRVPGVSHVYAINGGDGETPQPGLCYDGLGIEFVRFEDVADELDLYIEAAAQVPPEHNERVHARGGKCVAYRFGNAYVIDAERVLHGGVSGSIFNGASFDEVWTTPQHIHTCAAYWETCYRCPVRSLPHIWEPLFVDRAAAEMPAQGLSFGYQPRTPKRISVLEPNINLVKTAHIPMLAIEEACRARPDLVGDVYVTNALALKEHLTFRSFANNLDIVKSGRCSFEGRHNTPFWLARYTDVVVAHQWENALNYAYYDALHGAYPLVHNSPMLPSHIGYHYDAFDTHDGGRAVLRALTEHDGHREEYAADSAAFLDTVNARHPKNIEAHREAIARVMGGD